MFKVGHTRRGEGVVHLDQITSINQQPIRRIKGLLCQIGQKMVLWICTSQHCVSDVPAKPSTDCLCSPSHVRLRQRDNPPADHTGVSPFPTPVLYSQFRSTQGNIRATLDARCRDTHSSGRESCYAGWSSENVSERGGRHANG